MATNGPSVELGSLLIRLGFNASLVRDGLNAVNQFLNNTGNAAQRTGNQLHGAGARGAAGFSMLTRAAAGFTAVVTAGILVRKFVQSVAESNKNLENLRKNIGETAKEISKFEGAEKLAGGSGDGIKALISMLRVEQELYKSTGDSPLLPLMNWLQIDFSKIIEPTKMVIKLREQLLEKTGSREAAYAIGLKFGIDEGALNLLLKTDKEFKALMAKASETAMTDAESKSAERINTSFTALGLTLTSLNNTIMTLLEPTIIKFNTWLSNAADWIEKKLTAKGFQGAAASIVHKVLGVSDNTKDWGPPVDLTGISGNITSASQSIMNVFRGIPSFIDTFKSMDFFSGDFNEFLNENRFKNNPNLGRDLMERYQFSPGGNSQSSVNKSVENNIGEIKIYTQSNDQAGEIANRLDYLFTSQANSGLS